MSNLLIVVSCQIVVAVHFGLESKVLHLFVVGKVWLDEWRVLDAQRVVERHVEFVDEKYVEFGEELLEELRIGERTRLQILLAHYFDDAVLKLLLEGEVLAGRVELVEQLLAPRFVLVLARVCAARLKVAVLFKQRSTRERHETKS